MKSKLFNLMIIIVLAALWGFMILIIMGTLISKYTNDNFTPPLEMYILCYIIGLCVATSTTRSDMHSDIVGKINHKQKQKNITVDDILHITNKKDRLVISDDPDGIILFEGLNEELNHDPKELAHEICSRKVLLLEVGMGNRINIYIDKGK